MAKLTEQEKRVLYLVRLWQFKRLASPSASDIADTFGFSTTNACHHLRNLRLKGYIQMSAHKHWQQRRILFPKGTQFLWSDKSQFPEDIFEHMEPDYIPPIPSIEER